VRLTHPDQLKKDMPIYCVHVISNGASVGFIGTFSHLAGFENKPILKYDHNFLFVNESKTRSVALKDFNVIPNTYMPCLTITKKPLCIVSHTVANQHQ
jgi:hypothetical protein